MSEDDDGKTVFQPSKRPNRWKEDAPKARRKTDTPEKTLEKKSPKKEARKKKTVEAKDAELKKTKTTKVMQFDVGDVLNNVYEIKRFIAKGGMGEVYEAVNVHNTDERVAIKVMLPEFAADERVIAMFAKEAGTLTRLHHEAIVPYRLSSRDRLGRPFIVTAYVDGPSLEDQFKEFSPTEEELGRLTRRLAEGLGKAHSFGAIHRDIAPDNVLLVDGDPGLPKIIDFGIAQDARADTKSATIIGDGFAGKLNYVAPEQLGEYDRNIGPWTDIYSLALTMLAVATQKHADMGGSIASAVRKRMSVPDISSIPPRYRRAFKAALQPDPANRPQTMADFIKLMNKPAETEKASTFAPLNSDAVPKVPPVINETSSGLDLTGKGKLIGAAIGGGVLIGVISIFMMTRGGPPDTVDVVKVAPQTPDVQPTQEIRLTAAMVETAVTDIRCSWLSLGNEESLPTFDVATDSLRLLGGASNTSPQAAVSRTLGRDIGQGVNVDVSQVAKFDPKLCDVIGAIKDIKSPTRLIRSNETSRVFEAKTHRVSVGNGKFGEAVHAKINVEVTNIDPNKSVTILSIDPRGLLFPLANGHKQVKWLVDQLKGSMKEDGFAITFPTALESTKKEGYGFVVITGDKEFPQGFFTNTDSKGELPLSLDWINEFTALAQANNWTSDIYWFSVVDEVDN